MGVTRRVALVMVLVLMAMLGRSQAAAFVGRDRQEQGRCAIGGLPFVQEENLCLFNTSDALVAASVYALTDGNHNYYFDPDGSFLSFVRLPVVRAAPTALTEPTVSRLSLSEEQVVEMVQATLSQVRTGVDDINLTTKVYSEDEEYGPWTVLLQHHSGQAVDGAVVAEVGIDGQMARFLVGGSFKAGEALLPEVRMEEREACDIARKVAAVYCEELNITSQRRREQAVASPGYQPWQTITADSGKTVKVRTGPAVHDYDVRTATAKAELSSQNLAAVWVVDLEFIRDRNSELLSTSFGVLIDATTGVVLEVWKCL